MHAYGIGGTIRTVFHLAGHLAKTHDVEIISVVRENEKPFFPVPDGVRIRVLDDRLPRRKGLLNRFPSRLVPSDENASHWFTLKTDLKLIRYIRGRRTGVLIGTRPGINLILARFAGPEVIAIGQEHANLAAHKPETRKRILHGYGRLTALVTLTGSDQRAYRKALKRPPATIAQIPNAVTPLPGPPAALTGTTVSAIGRLNWAKGYDLLIRAWAHVHARHPDWNLRIYGTGPREQQLRDSIAKRDLGGTVHLMGATADVAGAMRAATVHVLSSRSEGMPMTLLEAMSMGLPVVSYDCPTGPAEILTHGHDGLLVPPGKIHAMADAISRLIEDRDLRRKLAAEGRHTASAYTMEAIGPRWDELFSELTRTPPARPPAP